MLAQLSLSFGLTRFHQSNNCANRAWVPYDASISPIENAFEKATDLDPQPEFPLRTQFSFFVEQESKPDKFMVTDGNPVAEQHAFPSVNRNSSNSPSFTMLLLLWILGLVVWCFFFVNTGGSRRAPRRRRTKNEEGAKDV